MLYLINKLDLIFSDGSLDSLEEEQRIENLECSEHFIGIIRVRKLVLEDGHNLCDDSVNLSSIVLEIVLPKFISSLTNVENIELVEQLVSIVDTCQSSLVKTLTHVLLLDHCLTDDFHSPMMLGPKVRNPLDSLLERVLHDVLLHDRLGAGIKSSTSLTNNISELTNLLSEHVEESIQLPDDAIKLAIL